VAERIRILSGFLILLLVLCDLGLGRAADGAILRVGRHLWKVLERDNSVWPAAGNVPACTTRC